MKKTWMIVGAATLAAAGALPWGVGYITELQWQQATEEVNRAQPFVRMETSDYRRGLLASQVDGVMVFSNPETGESHRWNYRADVTHGVTGSLLAFEPEGGWSPEGSDWFPEGDPRLTLETRWWGKAVLELEAPLMTMSNVATGESLVTSGGLARLELSNAGEKSKALMVWPSISLSGPEMDVQLTDIHVEQDMTHLAGDIWVGGASLEVGAVQLDQPAVPTMRFHGLNMKTSSEASENNTRLDSTVTVDLQEIEHGGQAYGPHHVAFAVDDLQVAGWNTLTEGIETLQAMPAADDVGDIELNMAAMNQINAAVRDLAAAGFSVGIPELSLATPEGAITGHGEIRHPQLTDAQKAGMLMVMQQLTGDFSLSLPRTLVEHYPEIRLQMAPLIKEGLLVPEGDRLVMNAVMRDLVLDVNGTEIPLPPLF
ncbi:YdgA family protein [Marinobacter salinisoli]|uniref:YdgA family protein n=1 Tax=Marinobacter salinisoli TaxID=2769486 RepID=A0ABX7MUU6_9GAMM|nr:DUF945 family protein [Marinobacter salinisoli]QSP95267.1 YdgA family protein [Marinobacter salinisoli]